MSRQMYHRRRRAYAGSSTKDGRMVTAAPILNRKARRALKKMAEKGEKLNDKEADEKSG